MIFHWRRRLSLSRPWRKRRRMRPSAEAAPLHLDPFPEEHQKQPMSDPQDDAAATPLAPKPAPKKAEKESWIETVKTVVYALLIALVIRTFLFQPFNIPSGSMEATL